LAQALRSKFDLGTVVVGAPQDGIPDSVRNGVIDTLGKFSIAELIAAIDEAAIVISTDSGPIHIAGVLARPIVGLFRKSCPEHAGRYAHARALFGSDPRCADCCRWDWCRRIPCLSMQAITVSDVLAACGEASISGQIRKRHDPFDHAQRQACARAGC
jgi:3-deoxy-D-manno-octulosonic-acid transferase/heptosyltransferase-1